MILYFFLQANNTSLASSFFYFFFFDLSFLFLKNKLRVHLGCTCTERRRILNLSIYLQGLRHCQYFLCVEDFTPDFVPENVQYSNKVEGKHSRKSRNEGHSVIFALVSLEIFRHFCRHKVHRWGNPHTIRG